MVEGFNGQQLLIGHLIAAVPALFAIARAWGFPNEAQLMKWMSLQGVDPHGAGRQLARTHLRRTRWIRTWGFVLGYCISPMAWLWFTRDARRQNEWPTMTIAIGCFAVAVVVAELMRPTLSPGPLTAEGPRARAAYAPAFTRFDPLVIGALFIALLGWAAAADRIDLRLVVLAVAAVLGWLVTLALQQWTLSRPQSAATIDELVIDDAIRSTSAINATSFGYGASIMAFGAGLLRLHETQPSGSTRLLGLSGIVIVLLGACFSLGLLRHDTGWVVRRLQPVR